MLVLLKPRLGSAGRLGAVERYRAARPSVGLALRRHRRCSPAGIAQSSLGHVGGGTVQVNPADGGLK